MKFLLTTILLSTFTAMADEQFYLLGEVGQSRQEIKPDIIKNSGDYHLKIFYFEKGTRSEGIYGMMLLKDKEIIGKSPEETIKAPFGIYVWHGPLDNKKQGWGCTGWLPKDLSTVYPSWAIQKAEQDAAANL